MTPHYVTLSAEYNSFKKLGPVGDFSKKLSRDSVRLFKAFLITLMADGNI